MRRIFLAFLSIGLLTAQTTAISPDDLLQRGREKYQTGRYADAVTDLTAAADAFLSPDIVQKYVTTGQPPPLTSFETAVVYLAMSYSKLGKDPQALEQIRRLAAAESIAPTYAKLSLGTDVTDFEALAKRVAPTISIPSNTAIAALPPPPPPGPPPPAPAAPVVASAEQQLAAAQQEANARVAAAHTTAEQEAAQRIATEKAAIQKAADEKIAAERAAIQKEADRVIAEARAAAAR